MISAYATTMDKINIDSLKELDDSVLKEVIREGERMLDAQLATANASDQRAMAWAAFLASGAVAITGGSAALLVTGKSLVVAAVGVLVAFIFGIAILKAIDVVRPKDWHFPGNRPGNWIPASWQCHGSGETCDLRQAMLEQAAALDEQICDNAEAASHSGRQLALSMDLALFAVALGALAIGFLVVAEFVAGPAGGFLDWGSATPTTNCAVTRIQCDQCG